MHHLHHEGKGWLEPECRPDRAHDEENQARDADSMWSTGCSGLQGDRDGSQHTTSPGRKAWNFQLLLPWLASGCTELGGSGGEASGASTAGCSATGQMINHLFPVCRTMKQDKNRGEAQ